MSTSIGLSGARMWYWNMSSKKSTLGCIHVKSRWWGWERRAVSGDRKLIDRLLRCHRWAMMGEGTDIVAERMKKLWCIEKDLRYNLKHSGRGRKFRERERKPDGQKWQMDLLRIYYTLGPRIRAVNILSQLVLLIGKLRFVKFKRFTLDHNNI